LCRHSSAAPSWLVAQFPAPLQGAAEPQRTSPDLLSHLAPDGGSPADLQQQRSGRVGDHVAYGQRVQRGVERLLGPAQRAAQPARGVQGAGRGALALDDVADPFEGADDRADRRRAPGLGDREPAAPAAPGLQQSHVLEFGDDLRGVRVRHVHGRRHLPRRGVGLAGDGEPHQDAQREIGGAQQPHNRQRK